MASVFFLFLTAVNYKKGRIEKIRFWGNASLHFAYIHIVLSLAILSKVYFPKFFHTDKMNLTGELTILLGVLAAYSFWRISNAGSDFKQRKIFQLLSGFLLTGHLVAMGFTNWLNIGKWYGGLPPISLVSVVLALMSLILFLKAGYENPG